MELNGIVLPLILLLPQEITDRIVAGLKVAELFGKNGAVSAVALNQQLVVAQAEHEVVVLRHLSFKLWLNVVDSLVGD